MCPIASPLKFKTVVVVGHLDASSACHLARMVKGFGMALVIIGASLRVSNNRHYDVSLANLRGKIDFPLQIGAYCRHLNVGRRAA